MPFPWPLSMVGRRLTHPVPALSSVSLQVRQGEIFGVIGPNGAGKTTLVKVLATVLLPSEGRAWVNGADVVRQGTKVRRAIGLVTGEERGFYWRLSGRENLQFFGGLLGLPPAIVRHRVQVVLRHVDLVPLAHELVGRYSTGMRHRLDLARALLADPAVLLLDEPTRSLDPASSEQIRALLGQLAREHGKTVLLVTHDLTEAATICDRVAILRQGIICDLVSVDTHAQVDLSSRYRLALGLP